MSRAAGKWADRCPVRPGHSSPIAAAAGVIPAGDPAARPGGGDDRRGVARSRAPRPGRQVSGSPEQRPSAPATLRPAAQHFPPGSIRSDLAAATTAIGDVLATVSRTVFRFPMTGRGCGRRGCRPVRKTMRPGAGVGAEWTGYTLLAWGGIGPAPGRRNADGPARLRSRSLAGTGWRFGASTWPPCRGPVRRQRSGRSCRCNEEGPWMVSC